MNTKNRILALLEAHQGENISGEHIAQLLDVSRTAVWKAIKELRGEGYHIAAVTNKGYCLAGDNDILSVQGIIPFLSPETRRYTETIYVEKTLESTNQTAKEMATAGADHGTVVIADCQTSGRGRYTRDFFSPAGSGLYMSMVLRPEILQFKHPTTVTAFAAVSVCEAIEAVSGRVPMIKWVNDLFLDGKKICGILTEAVMDLESGNFPWIVLGIGINVHTRTEDFPHDLQSIATSIYPTERIFGVRNRLCAEIMNRVLGISGAPNEADIFMQYKKRLMMLGKRITVTQGQTVYSATAIDVNSAGHLIVEKENGELATLSSGEICL